MVDTERPRRPNEKDKEAKTSGEDAKRQLKEILAAYVDPIDVVRSRDLNKMKRLLSEGKVDQGKLNNALRTATIIEYKEMVSFLLESGADPNDEYADPNGERALHVAAGRGFTEIAKILLEYGANPDATTKYGMTPLRFAMKSSKNPEMVALLRSSGSGKDFVKPPTHGHEIPSEKIGVTS